MIPVGQVVRQSKKNRECGNVTQAPDTEGRQEEKENPEDLYQSYLPLSYSLPMILDSAVVSYHVIIFNKKPLRSSWMKLLFHF
jgi:hypothetical protein